MSVPRRAPVAAPDPFARRTVRWLAAIVILSLTASVVMGAFGEGWTEPETAGPGAFSFSALGSRRLADWLTAKGLTVLVRQDPYGAPGGPTMPVLLDQPDLDSMAGQGTRLSELLSSAQRHRAPALVVLPKWRATADQDDPPWADSVQLLGERVVGTVLEETELSLLRPVRVLQAGAERKTWRCSLLGEPWEVSLTFAQSLDLAGASRVFPLVECEGGLVLAAILEEKGEPPLVLVSDPDLFDNQGLPRADHAALLQSLMVDELKAKGLILDESVHGFRRRMTLLAELCRFPLVLGTLHGVLLLGLTLWAGVNRFGKPQPLEALFKPGKQALIDNTADLLIHGGHAHDSLRRYLRDAERAVAESLGLPPELPENELSARLQKATDARRSGTRLWVIKGRIEKVAGPSQAVKLARAIHRWRQEMTDGR